METAKHLLVLVNGHVITEIIETKLIICHIGDITVVGCLTLFGGHGVQYDADAETEELMNPAHPLRITLCEVVIDRNDMDALALQCIQVCRTGRYEGLTLTGSHLCDTPLVKNDTTDQLYREVLHLIDTPCGFTYRRIRLRENAVQALALCDALLELPCLCL